MNKATINSAKASDREEIRVLLETTQKALHDKDALAATACYARDAVIFDLSPPLVSDIGTDPAKLQMWMDGWDGPIEQEPKDFIVTVDGDIAYGCGLYRLRAKLKSARRKETLWMRATLCFRREQEGWRIVHEHTSVPFYMDGSYRAAIDLTPEKG